MFKYKSKGLVFYLVFSFCLYLIDVIIPVIIHFLILNIFFFLFVLNIRIRRIIYKFFTFRIKNFDHNINIFIVQTNE